MQKDKRILPAGLASCFSGVFTKLPGDMRSMATLFASSFFAGIAFSFILFGAGNLILPVNEARSVQAESKNSLFAPKPAIFDKDKKSIFSFSGLDIDELVDNTRLLTAYRLLRSNRTEGVVGLLTSVKSEQGAKSYDYLQLYCEALLLDGKAKEALSAAERLMSAYPDDGRSLRMRARAKRALGLYESAAEDFLKAREAEKVDDPQRHERIEGRYVLTADAYLESILRRGLGACYEKSGRYREAVKEYEISILASSGYGPFVTSQPKVDDQSRARMREHLLVLHDGMRKRAPNFSNYVLSGDLNHSLGDFVGAVKDYSQALAILEKEERARALDSSSIRQQDEKERLGISSNSHNIYYKRASALYACKRFKEAAQDLHMVFIVDPMDGDKEANRNSLVRGLILVPKSIILQKLRELDSEILANRDNPELIFQRGILKLAMRRYQDAGADFGKFRQMAFSKELASAKQSLAIEDTERALAFEILCHIKDGRDASAKSTAESQSEYLKGNSWWKSVVEFLLSRLSTANGGVDWEQGRSKLLAAVGDDSASSGSSATYRALSAAYILALLEPTGSAPRESIDFLHQACSKAGQIPELKQTDEYFLARLESVSQGRSAK